MNALLALLRLKPNLSRRKNEIALHDGFYSTSCRFHFFGLRINDLYSIELCNWDRKAHYLPTGFCGARVWLSSIVAIDCV